MPRYAEEDITMIRLVASMEIKIKYINKLNGIMDELYEQAGDDITLFDMINIVGKFMVGFMGDVLIVADKTLEERPDDPIVREIKAHVLELLDISREYLGAVSTGNGEMYKKVIIEAIAEKMKEKQE